MTCIPLTVTLTNPVDAFAGTVKVMLVLVALVTTHVIPFKVTMSFVNVGSKPFPVMVIELPTEAGFGKILVMEGATVKFIDDVTIGPPSTDTVIGPVVAPGGTLTISVVLVELMTVAAIPL